MRVALALVLLGCLAAVTPCPAPAAQAPAHRCCCDPAAAACCCRGDSRQSRVPEPAAPSPNAAPDGAADLAVATSAHGTPGALPAVHSMAARFAGAETGTLYITARSFRC